MRLYTTLANAKFRSACRDGVDRFLAANGQDWDEQKQIYISDLLESNSLEDVLWTLDKAMPEHLEAECKNIIRLFACDCAEHVLHIYEKHYPEDSRPRDAITATRQFVAGEIAETAGDAARDAARDAAGAAAWAAARAAAGDAAGAAAWAAAGAAARAAAWDAAWAAAGAAAGAAEQVWQRGRLKEMIAVRDSKQ